jgi:hypothetical protein
LAMLRSARKNNLSIASSFVNRDSSQTRGKRSGKRVRL